MTLALSGQDIAVRLKEEFPGSVEEIGGDYLVITGDSLLPVLTRLKDADGLKCGYFNFITAVDYLDYFEIIYMLTSIEHNHSLVVKARCYDRDNAVLPSVTGLWQGADFQEREIYDLFGIRFEGHPNMKRIALWDGFPGHPLRKDFL